MKKKILKTGILSLCLLGAGATAASAATIDLFEYAFNVDGTVADSLNGDPVPAGINMGGFDTQTGLGTITATITGAGVHNFDGFFDHEIDQTLNTYYNETGAVSGAPAAGQSWEIDEPGYVFGDIFDNLKAGKLDNTNGIPPTGDDVSMAMGWDFILAAGQTATINLLVSTVAPGGGFYLTQYDPDSDARIYLSSDLTIGGGGNPVPEPCTMLLMGSGLAGLLGMGRRMRRS